MKKSNIVALVAITMLFLTLSAYGQTKPKSINLMVDGTFLAPENGEKLLTDEFKNLTGINLVLDHPAHTEYNTKVDLAFTTGGIPDVLILSGNQYVKYAVAGLLADVTSLYNNSSIKKNIKDPGVIESLKIKGKLYGIPLERGNGTITYVRGDWLDKLGMKTPTNYAEFLKMLRAFKNKNPDGLKPNEVIPITAVGLVNTEYPLDIYLREFYQDATPDYVQVNGKWVDGMLQPNFPAALERMRQAYAEGLIDTEIVTNKTSTARDKWNAGKVGAFNYWAGQWNLNLYNTITPNKPQAIVRPIPAIKETRYVERPATVYAITKAARDPSAVFKYFHEFVLDGGVGQKWITFGLESKMYKLVDGKVSWLPSIANPKSNFTRVGVSPELPVTKWNSPYVAPPLVADSLEMFQKNAVAYSLIPYTEEAMELVSDLNSIRSKYIAAAVFGKTDVKTALATYAKEVSKYHRIILRELNK